MPDADGSVIIKTKMDTSQAEKQLSKLTNKIEKMEDKLAAKTSEKNAIAEQIAAADKQIAETFHKVEQLKASLAESQEITSVIGPSISPTAYASELEKQGKITSELAEQEKALKEQEKAAFKLGAQYEKLSSQVEKQTAELNKEKTAAAEVADQIAQANTLGARAVGVADDVNVRLDKLGTRIAKLGTRVFVFSLITAGLRSLRSWLWNVIESNDEASSAIARLKGALLTMVQPLVNVVIPAFVTLVNVLTKVVAAIANVISLLFGTTAKKSAEAAKALNSETSALKSTGSAAKEAASSLAGFDEINQLAGDTSSSAGGTSADSGISADFSAFEDFDTQEYMDKVDELTVYMAGAFLALGALLTFSGANIPLGLALLAAGAIMLVAEIKENWNEAGGKVETAITRVLTFLGTASLVIGAFLAFSGINIPLGITLMAAGALVLGTAAKLNWSSLDGNIQNAITAIFAIVAVALLVIGAILVFSGANIPLGIGLMIVGAATLATAAALNWDYVKNNIETIIGGMLMLLGVALLVLGAILTFSGANIPLGISLMIAGAATLAAGAIINWDYIKTALKGQIGEITAAVSLALLVLGIMLVLMGVNIPLGIALIAAGAIGLVTMAVVNWDTIEIALKGGIGKLTAFISAAVLVLGILLCFTGVSIPLGIALIAAGAAGLATWAKVNWDFVLDKLKAIWESVKNWWNTNVAPKLSLEFWKEQFSNIKEGFEAKVKDAVNAGITVFNKFIQWINKKMNISWKSLKLFGQEIIPSGSFQLLTIPEIPKLAQGAVIPPNREFMAVLGDQTSGNNIEAPEDLIRQIVREESNSDEMIALLQGILEATKAGHVLKADKKVLARTVVDGINDLTTASGKPVLLY